MEKTVRKFLDTILDTATPLIATLNKGADDAQMYANYTRHSTDKRKVTTMSFL